MNNGSERDPASSGPETMMEKPASRGTPGAIWERMARLEARLAGLEAKASELEAMATELEEVAAALETPRPATGHGSPSRPLKLVN